MLSDIESGPQKKMSFHLAGIVPVAGQKLDFDYPWHDSLMPVGPNYLAVERAVTACAAAGCKTIWIVAHREMNPILRHRIGDWITDPSSVVSAIFDKSRDFLLKFKESSIYYVPIHPKDRDRRDCLSWSVIYGALRAYHVSKSISSWCSPDKYLTVFPYGLFSEYDLLHNRPLISSKKNFYMTYKGKSVIDGEYLPFTFDDEGFKLYRKALREGTGVFTADYYDQDAKKLIGVKRRPFSEQHSARHFTLDRVFGRGTLDGANVLEADWYHNIGSWEKYTKFLSSDDSKKLKRNKHFNYHEYNPIGVDSEDIK